MLSHPLLRTLKNKFATTFQLDFMYGQHSFSQEGEDLVLLKLFNYKKYGFFIDVGAHHPYRYSNTQLLSKNGWRGINIDATPGSMRAFQIARKHDKNLEIAVGSPSQKEQTYYLFADPAFNTFSQSSARQVIQNNQSQLQKKVSIPSQSLAEILDAHLPEAADIDFLNIDAEGNDLSVLRSNNWKKYQPKIIAIEVGSETTIKDLLKKPLHIFLEQHRYSLKSRLFNTALYMLR